MDFTILNHRVSAPRLGHAFAHGISGNLGWALAPVFLIGIGGLAGSWRAGCLGAGVLAGGGLARADDLHAPGPGPLAQFARRGVEAAPLVFLDALRGEGALVDQQVAALGHDCDGSYPWVYPPTFFFAAALVAALPLTAAHAVWVAATFAAFAATMAGIMRGPLGLTMALAFPGIVANATVGQNGFVTAALIGGMLIVLNSRPVVAGILLGLLSFKPHFGVLIPLVLIVGGYWRVLFSAAATTLLSRGT